MTLGVSIETEERKRGRGSRGVGLYERFTMFKMDVLYTGRKDVGRYVKVCNNEWIW